MDGQPFFVANQVVDPGLIQVVEQQIVPRLDECDPAQPQQATDRAIDIIWQLFFDIMIFERGGNAEK